MSTARCLIESEQDDDLFTVDAMMPAEGGSLRGAYLANPRKACELALHCTRDVQENERLEKINVLLGLYGVECIRGEWQRGYWGDTVAAYCNTGDSYAPTVMQVRGPNRLRASKFIVSSWGDFVERNSERHGIG